MKIDKKIIKFASVFLKNNFQIYLVGGAVRDQLLGFDCQDYDFATNAEPAEVMSIFPHVVPVGIDHGTVMVLFDDDEYEVTTFRTESTYADNRRPDSVKFVKSIEEDLKRRDLTINAFAYDLADKKLLDLFNGKDDLKKGIIRAIGIADERFKEDALRMLRACRIASKLKFKIETNTFDAIKRNASLISNISPERIRDELIKIMSSERPSVGIEFMRTSGLLELILPELLEGYKFDQNEYHKYDVYYHNLYSCDAGPKDDYIVRIALLFHDIAKPRTANPKESSDSNTFYNHEVLGSKMAYGILKRLKFPKEVMKKVAHLIRHHMFYYTDEWTNGAVRRFIRNVGIENIPSLFKLRNADREGNGLKVGIPKAFLDFQDRIELILQQDNALKVTDLEITGNDIINQLKIKPGPIIGEILDFLLENVLDNPEYNNNEKLLELTEEYYNKKKEYSLSEYGKPPEELGKF